MIRKGGSSAPPPSQSNSNPLRWDFLSVVFVVFAFNRTLFSIFSNHLRIRRDGNRTSSEEPQNASEDIPPLITTIFLIQQFFYGVMDALRISNIFRVTAKSQQVQLRLLDIIVSNTHNDNYR